MTTKSNNPYCKAPSTAESPEPTTPPCCPACHRYKKLALMNTASTAVLYILVGVLLYLVLAHKEGVVVEQGGASAVRVGPGEEGASTPPPLTTSSSATTTSPSTRVKAGAPDTRTMEKRAHSGKVEEKRAGRRRGKQTPQNQSKGQGNSKNKGNKGTKGIKEPVLPRLQIFNCETFHNPDGEDSFCSDKHNVRAGTVTVRFTKEIELYENRTVAEVKCCEIKLVHET